MEGLSSLRIQAPRVALNAAWSRFPRIVVEYWSDNSLVGEDGSKVHGLRAVDDSVSYMFERTLASTHAGQVRVAWQLLGVSGLSETTSEPTMVALKTFAKCRLERRESRHGCTLPDNPLREVENLLFLSSTECAERVMPLLAILEEEEFFHLVFPYAADGDLVDFVTVCAREGGGGAVPLAWCRDIFHGVIQCCLTLHRHAILHNDLSPENIVVVRNGSGQCEVRLVDFGLASSGVRVGDVVANRGAKEGYAAPEMWDESRRLYDPFAAEVWSLAIILCFLLFGQVPFRIATLACDEFALLRRHGFSVWFESYMARQGIPTSDVPADVASLLEGLLQLEPSSRPRLEEVLNHPFFRDAPTATAPQSGDERGGNSAASGDSMHADSQGETTGHGATSSMLDVFDII